MTYKNIIASFSFIFILLLIGILFLELSPSNSGIHREQDFLPIGHVAHTHDHGGGGCCPCGMCHDDEHEFTGEHGWFVRVIAVAASAIFLASKIVEMFM